MFDIRQLLAGYTILELYGADAEKALNTLTKSGIAFWDVKRRDALTVEIKVFSRMTEQIERSLRSVMCDVRLLQTVGLHALFAGAFRRPVLILFCMMACLIVLVLPKFVLFYNVSGNEIVCSERILQEVRSLGVGFGTYGPDIRPAEIKNHLLLRIPQLQWVTVTQNGCRAEIVVRERQSMPETAEKKGCSDIIASQSGIITSQSVYGGQAQFQVGDTVDRGDVLVSGIVDLDRIYVLEQANAEIFARTWRKTQVCIPSAYEVKTDLGRPRHCIWIILGDRRIKIFGNSGISYDSCDKMIVRKQLMLPGGLSLPVSLECETIRICGRSTVPMERAFAKSLMEAYVLQRVSDRMQAGQILHTEFTVQGSGGCFYLDAALECHEMIAENIPAKWNYEDFLHDGTYGERRENGADH